MSHVATIAAAHRRGWMEAVAVAGLYCLAFAALRLWLSPTIGVDDVEQVLVTQDFRLGYQPKQPPMFSWLLGLAGLALGPGLAALVVTKYALLFGSFVFYHGAAMRLLEGRWTPLLATASLTLFYVFGYVAHTGFTHTVTLLFFTTLSFRLLLELCDRPATWRYVAFGAAVGCGLLTKYNFLGAAVVFLLAAALDPGRRRAALDRRMALALLVAGLVFLPYGLWLLGRGAEVAALYAHFIQGGAVEGPVEKRVNGLGLLLKAMVEFLLPFAVLVPAIYHEAFRRRGWRQALRAAPEARFLLALHAAALIVPAAMVLVNGTRFIERYMVPYLLYAPVLVLALVEAKQRAGYLHAAWLARRQRVHAAVAAGLVVLVAAALAIHALRPPPGCGRCRLQKPFAGLAEALAGVVPAGTLIGGDEFVAGNLAPTLGLRTYSAAYGYVPPAQDRPDGACLLVWDAAEGAGVPERLRQYAAAVRGGDWPEPVAASSVAVPYPTAPEVLHEWRYAVLPAAGDCR